MINTYYMYTSKSKFKANLINVLYPVTLISFPISKLITIAIEGERRNKSARVGGETGEGRKKGMGFSGVLDKGGKAHITPISIHLKSKTKAN